MDQTTTINYESLLYSLNSSVSTTFVDFACFARLNHTWIDSQTERATFERRNDQILRVA